MYIFKEGVRLNGVKPEMVAAWPVIADVYASLGAECVITSVVDGRHSPTSLHYVGYATDFRTRHLSKEMQTALVARIKSRLTAEYDVILESNHLHVEFQPKMV